MALVDARTVDQAIVNELFQKRSDYYFLLCVGGRANITVQ